MADPIKKPDRLKPFLRINNDSFLAARAPDGLGVPCGCHTPDAFPDLDAEFKKFVDRRLLPGPLLEILDKVTAIAQAAANAVRLAAVPLAILVGPAALAVVAVVVEVTRFLTSVVNAITSAVHSFMILIGRRLARRAIHVIPQWVPVLRGASSERITRDQIKEIEGIVTRSFGDPIEPPFAQWHTWLNWSIHVQPDDRYRTLLSPAGNPPNLDGQQAGEQPLARPESMEIQWDVGALFADRSAFDAGLKEATEMPSIDGPMTTNPDLLWPMAGMRVWASGRWVYDCSRTTGGADPKMCTMLNPPRAIATATWEAVQFAEHVTTDGKPTKVPAIRFMFLACKRGGYMAYDSLAEEDYEFILDLPPLEQKVAPFPIAASPDVPHNVIVLRPRLLKSRIGFEFDEPRAKLLDPIVEEIPSSDPTAPPRQVKITIPKSQLDGVEAAGVILSLGWFDPNLERAATVKTCRVTFRSLSGRLKVRDDPVGQIRAMFAKEINELTNDIARRVAELSLFGLRLTDIKIPNPANPSETVGEALQKLVQSIVNAAINGLIDLLAKAITDKLVSEEWLVRVGVNGRWQSRYIPNLVKGNSVLSPPITFEVSLGPQDLLFYSSGGVEFNPVGDMMRAARSSRTLTTSRDGRKRPVSWAEIVSSTGNDHLDLAFEYALEVLAGNSTSANPALGVENAPLGVIDPASAQRDNRPGTPNPLAMEGVPIRTFALDHFALFARASGEQLVLLENQQQQDYQLMGVLEISPQR